MRARPLNLEKDHDAERTREGSEGQAETPEECATDEGIGPRAKGCGEENEEVLTVWIPAWRRLFERTQAFDFFTHLSFRHGGDDLLHGLFDACLGDVAGHALQHVAH